MKDSPGTDNDMVSGCNDSSNDCNGGFNDGLHCFNQQTYRLISRDP